VTTTATPTTPADSDAAWAQHCAEIARKGQEHWDGLSEEGRQRLLAERNPSDALSDIGCAAQSYGRRVSRG